MSVPCFPGVCVRRDLQVKCDGLERDKTALIGQRDELLSACESLLDDDNCECWNSGEGCRHDGARAAIAKARGQ